MHTHMYIHIYQQMELKVERKVELGPFTHRADDAEPLRKVTLTYMLLACL